MRSGSWHAWSRCSLPYRPPLQVWRQGGARAAWRAAANDDAAADATANAKAVPPLAEATPMTMPMRTLVTTPMMTLMTTPKTMPPPTTMPPPMTMLPADAATDATADDG